MVMYYTKEYLSALAPKIRMQAEAFDAAMAHFDEIDPSEAEEIARFLAVPTLQREEKDPTLYKIAEMENGDLLCVLLYMAAAGYTHENYKKKGIPDSIFYDSFNCLAEKMETAIAALPPESLPTILPHIQERQTLFREATEPVYDVWTCKNCGTDNKSHTAQCKKCGKFRGA